MRAVLISVVSFIFIVVIVFAAMVMFMPEKFDKPEAEPAATAEIASLLQEHPDQLAWVENLKKQRDSLKTAADSLKNRLDAELLVKDSLSAKLAQLSQTTQSQEQAITSLTGEKETQSTREEKAGEMAKTFSSMALKEMAPIVSNLDDRTIIDIYNKMSSRTKKNILLALDDKRAANITEKLISQKK